MVCVAAPAHVPTVVKRQRVNLIEAGLPTMPYHHESLAMQVHEADLLIARVRRSIARCASRALQGLVTDLSPQYRVIGLAVRELPVPELPETVATVRRSYQLQCSADGMMYQLALCRAAGDLGLTVYPCRRGEESARAAAQLQIHADDIESFVSRAGRPPGSPWTQEHRRAYAAGIAALAAHTGAQLTISIQR